MPLLAPSVILKSTLRIKFLYLRVVTISPPLVDSPPSLFCTFNKPSSIVHPLLGNSERRAPLQPSVVLPSHSSFHPSSISWVDNVLGVVLISGSRLISVTCFVCSVLFCTQAVVTVHITNA